MLATVDEYLRNRLSGIYFKMQNLKYESLVEEGEACRLIPGSMSEQQVRQRHFTIFTAVQLFRQRQDNTSRMGLGHVSLDYHLSWQDPKPEASPDCNSVWSHQLSLTPC